MDQSEFKTTILLTEDSDDDAELITSTIRKVGISSDVKWLKDGKELLSFLKGTGQYENTQPDCARYMILLDLNMPQKSGMDFLKEIKNDTELNRIPVIVFTTSQDDADAINAYNLGASSFIVKPFEYKHLVDIFKSIKEYWLNTACIPKVCVRQKMDIGPQEYHLN